VASHLNLDIKEARGDQVRSQEWLQLSGRFGAEPDAPFVLHNSYFGRKGFEELIEERNGLQMPLFGQLD
jgi:hypothetical protein